MINAIIFKTTSLLRCNQIKIDFICKLYNTAKLEPFAIHYFQLKFDHRPQTGNQQVEHKSSKSSFLN